MNIIPEHTQRMIQIFLYFLKFQTDLLLTVSFADTLYQQDGESYFKVKGSNQFDFSEFTAHSTNMWVYWNPKDPMALWDTNLHDRHEMSEELQHRLKERFEELVKAAISELEAVRLTRKQQARELALYQGISSLPTSI